MEMRCKILNLDSTNMCIEEEHLKNVKKSVAAMEIFSLES